MTERERADVETAGASVSTSDALTPVAPSSVIRIRYVELHCHSVFSLLDGAAVPEALVARAPALGMPALALTDHDDLGGAVRFAQAARASSDIDGDHRRRAHRARPADATSPRHLVLLAETREGYGNLAHARHARAHGHAARRAARRPRHARAARARALRPHGLPARLGAVARWPPATPTRACEAAGTLLDIFDGALAIECWDHACPRSASTRQAAHRRSRARSACRGWSRTTCTTRRARGRIVHDVLACLAHERTLDEMGTRLRPNGEWYLKAPRRCCGAGAAPSGVRATLAIAERCAFRLAQLKPTLPAFPLPPGVSADEYLARSSSRARTERWGEPARGRHVDGARSRTTRHAARRTSSR